MVLPTFLVIGAAKGGTTSLHSYLRQHPDVYLPGAKEVNYYSGDGVRAGRRVPRTLDEYAACFADAGPARAVGEVSPQYPNAPTAAERIAADLPGVRLVVSLRSPAERAWSDYLGRVRIARESRPAGEAIRPGERCYEDGFYHPRLRRFYDRFPAEGIHVILYDDFTRDPKAVLRALFGFLGVDPDRPIDTSTRRNPAEAPRSMALNRLIWAALPAVQALLPRTWRGTGLLEPLLRRTYRPAPPFPAELERRLRDAYRDDVLATGRLVGRDLSGWLAA